MSSDTLEAKSPANAAIKRKAKPEPASFPDRASFGAFERKHERVPLDALKLDEAHADDLELTVWATSPLVFSPVAMDVDALGRVWCTEGIDYSVRRRINAGQSIVVLTDSDQDGKADKSHVFVTERNLRHAPLGIAVFDNKIVLSATPDIIVYTDVDRNAVFDPKVDKREVLLTGFIGGGHDHTLHAVVGSPSGQWYFSYGNKGANIKTRDGQHFVSGSYYGNADAIGQVSSDGHLYVGGLAMRVNPDGTGLTPIGENLRNTHDMVVTSMGDVLHNDNDDPAHCRASWLMEYGNAGYADLLDGSKSWEEVAKPWEANRAIGPQPFGYDRIHGKDVPRSSASHWRENYPGSLPPGDVYGPGSPTGVTFIEGDELGSGLRGTYLACDMVHKAVLSYQPKLKDAQIDMGPQRKLLSLKTSQQGQPLLPTDVVVNTDGSLLVSDFYNSTSRRTVQVSGTIYRIARKGSKTPVNPAVDYGTTAGLIAALRSPANSVRATAAQRLIKTGAAALPAVQDLHQKATNPFIRARALWVVAQLGHKGQAYAASQLKADDIETRIVAYRALRLADPASLLQRAAAMASDPSPAVRREVALSLRDVPFTDGKKVLATLIAKYAGDNRWSLEALGAASANKEGEVYREIIRPSLLKTPHAKWDRRAKSLAWRMHTPEAAEDLNEVLRAKQASLAEFRWLIMGLASFRDEPQRLAQQKLVEQLAKHPHYKGADYQLTIDEVLRRDLHRPKPELLRSSYLMPSFVAGELTKLSPVAEIAKLKGDAKAGEPKAASCLACHRVNGAGIAFGPNLSAWARTRTANEIITAIVDPAEKLAHGYESPVRVVAGKHVAEGLLSNYSYHAGSLKLKVFGGETKKILFRRSGAKINHLKNFSWMPSASQLGMSDQDVADVAAYLQHFAGTEVAASTDASTGKPAKAPAPGNIKPAFSRGEGPGWVTLTGKDFLNVNCWTNTFEWKGGHAFCTGKPTGVIRYKQPLKNFELSIDWMHKEHGGNAGIFVWAKPEAIVNLTQGKGRLPAGIEVQVLDLGYTEKYKKQFNKPADWFTCHGDVFPVGGVHMKPFPPVAPNGKRSFPSKHLSLGINNWNHYYIRAIDGEVRLWVNGVEVSGGNEIKPDWGFLCLESEGAPIEFKNIRLRVLSETPSLPKGMEITVPRILPPEQRPARSLKGHPILGTWHYLKTYTREFTPDGRCILRNGKDIIWTKKAVAKTKTSVTLEGGYKHELDGDKLKIEGRYVATRKK